MKKLIASIMVLVSFNTMASNTCLTKVLNDTINSIPSHDYKENVKAIREGMKYCNEKQKEIKKVERENVKRAKIAAKIAELQAKLK